eukprot:1133867-Amphidinium_carterae.1
MQICTDSPVTNIHITKLIPSGFCPVTVKVTVTAAETNSPIFFPVGNNSAPDGNYVTCVLGSQPHARMA